MHVFINQIKKLVMVAGIAITINALVVPIVRAQPDDTGTTGTSTTSTNSNTSSGLTAVPPGVSSCTDTQSCLIAIMTNTYATLQSVNNIPALLQDITATALSWYAHDDTKAIQTMQGSFTALGNILTQDVSLQNSVAMRQQLAADLFGVQLTDITQPTNSPAILGKILNANELIYPTVLNLPPIKNGQASPYNYVKAAAGIMLPHGMPPNVLAGSSSGWTGGAQDQQNYLGYYYTVTSVESFDAYVLSSLYADNQNFQATGSALSPTQATLVSEASNGDWLTAVASEDLGKVLRQLLVFQSQSYVLLSDLVQTERQLLTAQVMTNSLLIANNMTNEGLLLAKAKSKNLNGK